ncbi:hypothetical protein [Arthrobacter koreensis]|uniref:hypothetical protein n=1 Tax=Arthrobacter koreensis TaxID=199136 RepID=UPI002409CEF4|nr:hypothetical protein [Arthrobacter koreensis]
MGSLAKSDRGIQFGRSLVFDFDSLEQKNSFARYLPEHERFYDRTEGDLPADASSFAGILRAADLLSRSILVLDVQLLDGVLFLDRGPATVRQLLARDPGHAMLTVLSRAPSLPESLRSLLLGPDEEAKTLTGFEFSSLGLFDPGLPRRVAQNLKCRSNQRIRECSPADIARTVAAELQAASKGAGTGPATQPTGDYLKLAITWESWFDEADARGITVQQWDRDFDLRSSLVSRQRSTERSLAEAQKALSSVLYRSQALSLLESFDRLATSEYGGELRDWWMNAYFDALGRQHGANWLRFRQDRDTGNPPRRFLRTLKGHAAEPTIGFQGSLVTTLHDMPGQAYALMRHQAREAIRDWHANPSQRTSDNLAYTVANADLTVSRRRVRSAMWKRVALTVVPAATGVLGASFFASLLAGVGTALLSILVAVPLVEFTDLHATRKKAMRAYIHFPAIQP